MLIITQVFVVIVQLLSCVWLFLILSPWKKSYDILDNILNSRDITLPSKVHLVRAMVFPLVMYGYESWTIKKAEHWRTDALELCCWRRLWRVPWAARSNQSILKEISPEYSLERLVLKLNFQYFGHLMWRTDSFEKTLMLWKIEGKRRREKQDEIVGWHHAQESEQDLGVGEGQGSLVCCSPQGRKESDMTEGLTWTELLSQFFFQGASVFQSHGCSHCPKWFWSPRK